jgi:hypothetical protein
MSEDEKVQQWNKSPAIDHEAPNTKQFLNPVTISNVRSGMYDCITAFILDKCLPF